MSVTIRQIHRKKIVLLFNQIREKVSFYEYIEATKERMIYEDRLVFKDFSFHQFFIPEFYKSYKTYFLIYLLDINGISPDKVIQGADHVLPVRDIKQLDFLLN